MHTRFAHRSPGRFVAGAMLLLLVLAFLLAGGVPLGKVLDPYAARPAEVFL